MENKKNTNDPSWEEMNEGGPYRSLRQAEAIAAKSNGIRNKMEKGDNNGSLCSQVLSYAIIVAGMIIGSEFLKVPPKAIDFRDVNGNGLQDVVATYDGVFSDKKAIFIKQLDCGYRSLDSVVSEEKKETYQHGRDTRKGLDILQKEYEQIGFGK